MSPILPLALGLLSAASASTSRHRHISSRATNAQLKLDQNVPLGGFLQVGNSGVSAQMMFLGTESTVYILDKTENNAMTVQTSTGVRPAWGSYYTLSSNSATAMAVSSNTFCAGGMSLADGRWAVFGGNQPVTYNGTAVDDKTYNPTGANPYQDTDGGEAVRVLTPCDGGACSWQEGGAALTMTSKRWYPMVEALGDGSLVILGGDTNGGYVSTFAQNNPTFEYWPKQSSGAITMDFLNETVPLNLFPLTWLTASGKLFMQASYRTILYDMNAQQEYPLPDMPYAARVYPASAASVMLPLTPQNNYAITILFCGGSSANFSTSSDGGAGFNVTAVPADDSCVRINPDDQAPQYLTDDWLPEGRSMGQFVYLPDGTMWLGNGVNMGTAGYGNEHYSFGQSYGQAPVYTPLIYNPNAASGSRFSRSGLGSSSQERMYHSSAILLPDGAILVSGSNPNADVSTVKWATSYSVEKWYPFWYSSARPTVTSPWPSSLSYGGQAFNLTFTYTNTSTPADAKVVIIRTGFSTHAMNFGQRYLELPTSYTIDQTTSTPVTTLHVGQMPPNANIFQPGPAMAFLVIDGVPSMGQMIMVGSGQIGQQPLSAATTLPQSSVITPPTASKNSTSGSTNGTAQAGANIVTEKKTGGAAHQGLSGAALCVSTALLVVAALAA